MMFAQNEWSFYLLRVLLGITEAGFFPGVILYLTYWIPTQFRGSVNGLFYFGAPLAFIFGGPLSGLLLDLDGLGGLQGWQLMFVVTGALTVAVGHLGVLLPGQRPGRCQVAERERTVNADRSASTRRNRARPTTPRRAPCEP